MPLRTAPSSLAHAAGAASFALALLLVAAPGTLAQERIVPNDNVMRYIGVDEPTVVLQNVTVIDGTAAPAARNQSVVIADGRIAAVGPAATTNVPEGARVIDLAGHTVFPGFVGLHNHTYYTTSARRTQMDFSAPRLYLASGVTTIRTTGSYAPYSELNLKASIDAGQSPGPRIFVTGPYITGGQGMTYMTRVTTPEDARRVVRYWAEEGVSWFKAYTLISRAELGAAIDEAHKHGVKVTGHLCSVSFREAVALGIDNLEHGFFTNTDYDADKPADECPSDFRESLMTLDLQSDEVQATFREMIDAEVPMTSTLAVYEMFVPNRPPMDQRMLDAMSAETREEFLKSRAQTAEYAGVADYPFSEAMFQKALQYEKMFYDAGGLLASGVDPTGYGGALPGYGDQRNYELLREAGFSPEQTIQIMSANGAKVLGIYDEVGSVEPGKVADIVVIRGDLATNDLAIRDVNWVFRDGYGFDSGVLIEAVEGSVGLR
jgi:imidazolonepropionase-like amidohydrolase